MPRSLAHGTFSQHPLQMPQARRKKKRRSEKVKMRKDTSASIEYTMKRQ
jgi:hypothetical protein